MLRLLLARKAEKDVGSVYYFPGAASDLTWSVSVFVINYSSEILDWVFKDLELQTRRPGLALLLIFLVSKILMH